jgi:hypothetical protein
MSEAPTIEWLVETVDQHGDIVEVAHANSYAKALSYMAVPLEDGLHYEFGLVRDRYDRDGYLDRTWAYAGVGRRLPERFSDAYGLPCTKVPAKYQREIDREESK